MGIKFAFAKVNSTWALVVGVAETSKVELDGETENLLVFRTTGAPEGGGGADEEDEEDCGMAGSEPQPAVIEKH